MDKRNPCDVCHTNNCCECVLLGCCSGNCYNEECFVHIGDINTCALSLYEECGAWLKQPVRGRL